MYPQIQQCQKDHGYQGVKIKPKTAVIHFKGKNEI